tara:strand:- start:6111 stop:6995 length:885 start_codon:yes stop_codon:yes gene_type:complete
VPPKESISPTIEFNFYNSAESCALSLPQFSSQLTFAAMIHPTAIVDEAASLGKDVRIGPFSIVEGGVTIGDNTELSSHVVIKSGVVIGADCKIDSFSVIGGDPNHMSFDIATRSGVLIGNQCVFRESVTIHRSIYPDTNTLVGNNVFLMAGSHIAHDCDVGDQVIFANQVAIAGHSTLGRGVFMGGGAMIHQFTRIGDGAMISGLSRISKDIAPFLMVGERDHVSGLNLIGLRRSGVPAESIREIKELFRTILLKPGNPIQVAANQPTPSSPEARLFLEFFISSKRGYAKNVVA